MAPTDPISTQIPEPQRADTPAFVRVVVYVVAALVLCVVAWALMNGGERDLWTRSANAAIHVWPTASAW